MHFPATSVRFLPNFDKITLALLLAITTDLCHAEAKLKAYVVLNTEKGNPVAQVPFSADGQNEVSLTDGSLEMHFAQRNPGDVVRLVMSRPGWEVVNRYVMDHTLRNKNDTRPLEIIIVKAAEFEQKALAFYRLKGERAVEQEVSRALTKLRRTNSATAEAMARLENERDQARKQVDEFARLLAQTKPGETGKVYNQALTLFLDGKPDQALELLSEARLQKDAVSAIEKAKQNAKEWQLRAQILVTKFDFAGASKAYEKVTEILPGDGDVWFQYGIFHQNQNKRTEARQGLEHALSLYRLKVAQDRVAMVQNHLGKLHIEENRNAEALTAFGEALKIYIRLAKKNPGPYYSDVAQSLSNIGVVHTHENRTAEAREAHELALGIFRKLAKWKPDDYLYLVPACLNNLGNLYKQENRMGEARAVYEEALAIRRQLSKKNPEAYLADVAMSLSNLGNMNTEEDRMVEARAVYEEALGIFRQLAQKNPDAYLSNVAASQNNLGILHSQESRLAEAHAAYKEALTIYRQLVKKNPEVYLPDVANSLNNLGVLYRQENRKAQARAAYEEAMAIFKRLGLKSVAFRNSFNSVQRNLDSLEK